MTNFADIEKLQEQLIFDANVQHEYKTFAQNKLSNLNSKDFEIFRYAIASYIVRTNSQQKSLNK